MASQKSPERRKNRRYTVVLVPEGETRKPITLSFSLLGLTGVICGSILVLMSLVVAAIMYTPLGARLPIHSAELERRYGKQIVTIQAQLHAMVQELGILQAYNLQLRKALGEDVDSQRVALMQSMARDSAKEMVAGGNVEPEEKAAGGEGVLPEETSQILTVRSPEGSGVSSAMPAFPFLMPVAGFESRGFDVSQLHYGIDFAGKRGAVVQAAADGTVLFSGWTYDDGYTVILGHDGGYVTTYKHNQTLLKQSGAYVRRGEAIALLGNTGTSSSGPHLHFEVWKNGVPLNPGNYFLHNQ